ncbi:SPOR domain-containing protein [Aidingimonas lacisalsi]|uniref:SPOR domain-containing protein n=1 Tax=Aidingimonas lacisalsi TaxID=2604086 RepID=UPI0011D23ED5|nr:SPOR domain-containing protein [Aidingimonas lacisalsi]
MAARKGSGSRRGATTRKRSAKQSSRPRFPGWFWGVGGLIAGFFLAQYLQDSAPQPMATVLPKASSPERTESSSPSGEPGGQASDSDEGRMPTFEFYTLLPESEVIAPGMDSVVDTATATVDDAEQTSQSNDDSEATDPIAAELERIAEADNREASEQRQRYMLQAASFRQSSDASNMAGRLRDVGLTASVNEVQTSEGDIFHRVQVGPYTDDSELNRAQDLMMAQGIEPLMIQVQN